MRFTTILLCAVVLLSRAWGQATAACSAYMTRGLYSLTCTGWVSPAPEAAQVPFSLLGTIKADWAGNIAGHGKASLGGEIIDTTATGFAVVNGDCTGTVTYERKFNGRPAPKLTITFHVFEEGKEMRGMSVDPGNTMSCSLRLLGR